MTIVWLLLFVFSLGSLFGESGSFWIFCVIVCVDHVVQGFVECLTGFCLFCLLEGVWWMPWYAAPMKDVWGRDRPGGVADRTVIPGFPNGVTRGELFPHTSVCWGERREVKHLSTYRRRYSGSSGERNWMRLNRVHVILCGGCVHGVVGLFVLSPQWRAAVEKV